MLADHVPIPTLAVADLDRARAFYEGVLHLAPQGDAPDGVLYGAGGGTFLVYPSSFAGTNKATALSFRVPPEAFDAEVAALCADGVTFLTFEFPGERGRTASRPLRGRARPSGSRTLMATSSTSTPWGDPLADQARWPERRPG